MSNELSTKNVEVQTILNVRPFILDYPNIAKVTANRTTLTEIAIKPVEETKQFYSLLQYTPYQDIRKGSLRTLNLPKAPTLSFRKTSLPKGFTKLKKKALKLTLCDDDGFSEVCSDLLRRQEQDVLVVPEIDNSTQTKILVMPHILNQNAIAKVYALK
ncbi:unnamed protein product [Brassicogethes aeneus]|uniref:Uncharacterized protein n=1 Tax=Brassicogethes aeneus TaxID=1431903 RepID=A0A9P0B776_BRAAE|nr:unnamed protein product [Brassicogethes aeneus]